MKTFRNDAYSRVLNERLNRISHPFVCGITTMLFEGVDYYLWGGFVRDSLNEAIHGIYTESKDVDYLVNHYDEEYSGLPFGIRFSDYEWQEKLGPDVYRIWLCCRPYDFGNMDFNKARSVDKNNPRGLEYNLNCCDLNTSAIAYSPVRDEFYDSGAIAAIIKKEIDVKYIEDNKSWSTLSRLVLHSEKLGFNIGLKSLEYVYENYSDDLDCKIIKYLKSRDNLDKADLVLTKLKEIKNKSK